MINDIFLNIGDNFHHHIRIGDVKWGRSHFSYKPTINIVLPHIVHIGGYIFYTKTSIQHISSKNFNKFSNSRVVTYFLQRYSISPTLKNLFGHISYEDIAYLLHTIICSITFPSRHFWHITHLTTLTNQQSLRVLCIHSLQIGSH